MSAERITAAPANATDTPGTKQTIDKAQVARLAAEFESLLLSNIFRDMRSAGRWSDEDSTDTLGAGAFGQTFDTELARTLSQAGGFGLSGFLQQALNRYGGGAPAAAPPAAAPEAAIAAPPLAPARPVEGEREGGGSADKGLQKPSASLTSAFGWRRDPLTGQSTFHRGVDLKAAEGDPVSATGSGSVVFSGRNGGYGNSVVIEHANGLQTRYAHLSAALVHVGDQVNEGQQIGRAGHTGRATGPHVHYEVLAQGRAVDPLR